MMIEMVTKVNQRSFNWIQEVERNDFFPESIIEWKEKLPNYIITFFENQHQQSNIDSFKIFPKENIQENIKEFFSKTNLAFLDDNAIDIPEDNKKKVNYLLRIGKYFDRIKDIDTILETKYVITNDNFLKIILILKRLYSGLPVIIFGETGCGKTRLINYIFIDLFAKSKNTHILNINGGTTENDINKFIREKIQKTNNNNNNLEIAIFDEFNTASKKCISLIKQIIFERIFEGKQIPKQIQFIGIANPLRKQNKSNKNKNDEYLLDEGLIYEYDENTDELKRIRESIYRVHSIPDSFFDYIYDFGNLEENIEKEYLQQMIQKQFQDSWGFTEKEINKIIDIYKHLLFKSHHFTKDKSIDKKSSISLRDANRALEIWSFLMNFKLTINLFLNSKHQNYLQETKSEQEERKAKIIISIILSIFISYVCKFSKTKRKEFYEYILKEIENYIPEYLKTLEKGIDFPNNSEEFSKRINEYQQELFNKIDKDEKLKEKAIAPNEILIENLLLIFICIQNKIN
ncbi:hypothetical protein M0811_12134 [Anaeramoeba ignava]|uniref:AAA+ ATPase domain-containing protein n=1 Tax=Anaeramoeba ignava TaxID=1746090 RepID=A0A9Q0LC25_ANAIG|nr:hypothetical protein M0811_12134 [Anaeramoeba ignava]